MQFLFHEMIYMPYLDRKINDRSGSNKQQVDIDVRSYRLLPYSIVFDILNFYQDADLNAAICDCLINTLPHRDHYQNDIDLWIDLESTGDITLVQAKALATIITDFIQTQATPLVISLSSKDEMTRDNKILLFYLQFYDRAKFIFDPWSPPCIEEDNDYLKWPCFTPSKTPVLKDQNYTEGVESIIYHAWRCSELGAEEVGFKIMEEGIRSARVFYIKQLYLVQLQFMRIATQFYPDAADEKRSVCQDFPALYDAFNLSRAWGSILSRRPREAMHFFALANITMETMPSDLDSLYRMNIYALAQHITGRIDNAFVIEARIEAALTAAEKNHPQMTYINSINLARLYRFAGNYLQAQKYFEKAFNVQRKKKSETDLIYQNVCYGKLNENQSLWLPALQCWLRAAFHWINALTPEALGWRAIRAIAFQEFKPRSWLDCHIIDEAILGKLLVLYQKLGGNFTLDETRGDRLNLVKLVAVLKDIPEFNSLEAPEATNA
jgi:tetratricopeptide (TPR) repeat protein